MISIEFFAATSSTAVLDPNLGFILLGIFSVIWVGLGFYWGSRSKDLEGFMLAGRNVGLALGAATAMATWVTSNTIMLAPQFALQHGIWGVMAYATASFGLILFAPLALRIRRLMPNGFTSGDFIRLRYGNFGWGIFLIISFVYSMAWLVSMATAGGVVLQALSGIDYQVGMSVILFVCVLYTMVGGLYAVIGTDYVQSVIILIGVVLVGGVVVFTSDLGQIHSDISQKQPMLMTFFFPAALLVFFNNMFFGFGEIFHNNVWWTRAFAMKEKVVGKAFFLSGLFWFSIPIAAGFIGLCAFPLDVAVPDPNMVGPLVASQVLGQVGAIVLFITVFCSLASSIDSLLAATSDLLTEDVYKRMMNPLASDSHLRFAALVLTFILGLATWLICLNKMDLLQVLFLSGPLVASTIWPVIGGLYWKTTNRGGAVLAMLLGSGIGLCIYYSGPSGWTLASIASAAISMVVTCLTTWLLPEDFDWQELNESQEAENTSA